MKTLTHNLKSILWVVLVGLSVFSVVESKAQQAEVSFQIFYDELAPYGRWLLHPKYGDVWVPDVQGEFTPYLTNGYWTVTQYGNTWVSNYDWGWATFHYGRWYYDEFEGWVWIPDTVWAPAWVVWRNGGGYYGWAAISPGLNFSVSLNIFNDVPHFYWCFVPQQYVWRPYVYRYCAPRHRNVYIVNNTNYVTHNTINNVTYNYYTGPSHTEITYVTNRPVVIHHIEHTDRPGRNQVSRDKIAMFTPVVKRNEMERPALGSLGNNNGWGKNPVRGGHNNSGHENGSENGNDQGNGGTGNNSGGHGNNGHGNGDQDAPGKSGGNNNGENSENSGHGNSGKGKNNNDGRWSSSGSDRSTGTSINSNFENRKRTENDNVRNYRTSEIKKSSNIRSGNQSGWSDSNGNSNKSFSSKGTDIPSGTRRSYTPSRSNSPSGSNRSFTPNSGNSGSSGKSYTPSRSSGNSGSSNRSITPSRSSSSPSGGGKSITPNRSSGSSLGNSKSRLKN